jgi:hypothetical protein
VQALAFDEVRAGMLDPGTEPLQGVEAWDTVAV